MKNPVARFVLAALSAVFLAAPATAAEYHVKIVKIWMSAPGNMPFRVVGTPGSMPTCQHGFAYLDSTHGNYQVYVSLLTTAAMTGKTVELIVDVAPNGFCIIRDAAIVI